MWHPDHVLVSLIYTNHWDEYYPAEQGGGESEFGNHMLIAAESRVQTRSHGSNGSIPNTTCNYTSRCPFIISCAPSAKADLGPGTAGDDTS
jgi:hypothetical protein